MLWWTLQQLKSKRTKTRLDALQRLALMPSPLLVESASVGLSDPQPEVRCAAARVLGRTRVDRALEPLAGALRDASAEVRQAAADALGTLANPRAVGWLAVALKDSDASVRW